MNKSGKSNNIDVELNPMAKDFFSSHLNSNSSFFNLCVGILTVGILKSVIVFYTSTVFLNLYVSVYKKLEKVNIFQKMIHHH